MIGQLSGGRLVWLGVVTAALIVGILVGWVLKPAPRSASVSLAAVIEDLDDVEKRTGAVVEILNDMAAGKISGDEAALRTLRDSMQELTEAIGDVVSQLRVIQQTPR